MAYVMTAEQVQKACGGLPGWSCGTGTLHKELKFRDFNEAFGFMARVALVAEKRDHHPDWSNSWNKVVIDITNHDAGGLTERCFALVAAVDAAAGAAPGAEAVASSIAWRRVFQERVAHLIRTGNFTTPRRASRSPSFTSGSPAPTS